MNGYGNREGDEGCKKVTRLLVSRNFRRVVREEDQSAWS